MRRDTATAAGAALVSGVMLGALRDGDGSTHLPWYDPVVLSTLLMLLWLLSAVLMTARLGVARQGRAVAYLTLVSFVFLAIALAVMLLADTRHGGRRAEGQDPIGTLRPGAVDAPRFLDRHARCGRAIPDPDRESHA